jgi:lysophosphatidylcholine acyltransferase/lyso-PAF acetyltransferase
VKINNIFLTRSCLAQFKAGAFLAGVPVQPIAVRYPNRLDCVTWTFDGPSGYNTIHFTFILPSLNIILNNFFRYWSAFVALTQFHNSIEIEFLPVYTPSEEEKHDAVLYATNIQRVVAEYVILCKLDIKYKIINYAF